jgi:hypothetical protein
MATRPFSTDRHSVEGSLQADRPQSAGRINRYQLQVVGTHTVEVVESAGGWLCDRARAGWDVNVLVADHQDARPLTILGATTLDLDAGFASVMRSAARGGALAIGSGLLGTDARVRAEVLRLLKRGLTEVIVWGTEWPAELGRRVDPVQRPMSNAARAFKAHALGAAAVSNDSISPTETLFYLGAESFRPLYSV